MFILSLLMVMSWFLLMSIRNRVCVFLIAFLSVVLMWSCGIAILMVVMFWFLILINFAMEKNVIKLYKVSLFTSDGAPLSWSRRDLFFERFEDAVYDVDSTFKELVNGLSQDLGDKLICEKVDDFDHYYVRQACLLVEGLFVILKVIVSVRLIVVSGRYKSEHSAL